MIKLLVVDDHKLVREGIIAMLRNNNRLEIVAEADNGRQALEFIQMHSVDIVLMDINMPEMDGIETTTAIGKNYPEVKVLGISMHKDEVNIIAMLKAGASGYILKNSDKHTLHKAIMQVHSGNTFFPPDVAEIVMNHHLQKKRRTIPKEEVLTNREKEVLYWIVEGLTNSEIAEKLFISKRTVDSHRNNLLEKLNAKNTAALVKYAVKYGIADL